VGQKLGEKLSELCNSPRPGRRRSRRGYARAVSGVLSCEESLPLPVAFLALDLVLDWVAYGFHPGVGLQIAHHTSAYKNSFM